ncbi:MAG: serine hydrolase domain-containing protein [Rhodoglobus sp.]
MSSIKQILRSFLARDSAAFASRWPGKLMVVSLLVGAPAALLLGSLYRGTYINDSWVALLTLVALGGTYLVSKRLIVSVLVSAVVVGVTILGIAPRLATERTGETGVLAELDLARDREQLTNFRDVAVAMVDLSATRPVQFGGFGADGTTRFEVGSLTKAMTGLVIADAVARGEIQSDVPVATYLPELAGTAAGTVSLEELVTHTAGYAPFGPTALGRGFWGAPVGHNFFATDVKDLISGVRAGALDTRGSYVYSSLGASTAGMAVAAATGLSYSDLMRTRLFEPLDMTNTAVENDSNAVDGGWSKSGLPVEPWILGADAPGGGVVSTAADLAKLASALLDGTAPGMTAMDPNTPTGLPHTSIGMFWHTTVSSTKQVLTWHTGQTGGYSTYFGLDRENGTAVILLSNVSNPAISTIGIDLLTERNPT